MPIYFNVVQIEVKMPAGVVGLPAGGGHWLPSCPHPPVFTSDAIGSHLQRNQ